MIAIDLGAMIGGIVTGMIQAMGWLINIPLSLIGLRLDMPGVPQGILVLIIVVLLIIGMIAVNWRRLAHKL